MKTIQVDDDFFAFVSHSAKNLGVSVSKFLISFFKKNGVKPKLTANGFTEEEEDEILRIEKDALAGRNVDVFETAEDFLKDMKKRI